MVGTGPDVIFVNQLNDPYKAMENRVLLDPQETIENDSEFDMSAFNQRVMDAGVHRGRRYFLPVSYGIYYLEARKAVLSEIGYDFSAVGLIAFLETPACEAAPGLPCPKVNFVLI